MNFINYMFLAYFTASNSIAIMKMEHVSLKAIGAAGVMAGLVSMYECLTRRK